MVRKEQVVGVFRKKVRLPEALFVSMDGAAGLRTIPATAHWAIGAHLAAFGWTPHEPPASAGAASETRFNYGKESETGQPVNLVYRVNADTRNHFVVVKVAISGKGEIAPEDVRALKGALAAAVSAVEEAGHRLAS
jgi:hypothetical protein